MTKTFHKKSSAKRKARGQNADQMARLSEIQDGFSKRMRLLRRAWEVRFARSFAAQLGINEKTLYSYEDGTRMPRYDRLHTIVKNGGVTADWLLYDDWDSLRPHMRKLLQEYQRLHKNERGNGR